MAFIEWLKKFFALWSSKFQKQPVPAPTPSPDPQPTPVIPVAPKDMPLRGWSQDYNDYISQHLTQEMLDFPCPSFCPRWESLSQDQRRKMWAAILESTSFAESGFNRLDMYMEFGIPGTDPVTGLTIVSEGFLQISYGDSQLKGLFDWSRDKALFQADIGNRRGRSEWDALKPRTIHDGFLNLQGGINIWTQLIQKFGNAPALTKIGGQYWSTMRDGRSGDTIAHFRQKFPEGF